VGTRYSRGEAPGRPMAVRDTRPVTRIALAAAAVAALAASAAGASSSVPVRADGQIGSFRLDATTEAQVRALAGRPRRIEQVYPGASRVPAGHTLVYRCGPRCETAYSFSRRTARLSDFTSASPLFVTERGAHVGMRAWQARKLEGTTPVKACGPGRSIRIRWDAKHHFLLHEQGGAVDSIAYFGPHTLFPAAC
jgi:hypothetical protein